MKNKDFILRSGYRYIHKPEHPYSGKQGYIAEHRLIMEKHLGRYLKKEEAVHHINHIITDNKISNLRLYASHGQHTAEAHPEHYARLRLLSIGRSPPNKGVFKTYKYLCSYCNKEIVRTGRTKKRKPHYFCSMSCSAIWSSEHNKGERFSKRTEFKKGQVPWNKGKSFSSETKEKMRKSALARKEKGHR